MSAIDVNTQRDVVKQVQSVVEGNTPATYGVTPTDPAFLPHGRNARLIEGAAPIKNELREVGDVNRIDVTKTREVNTVTYRAFFLTADEALLASAMNEPAGALTPDESKTMFWSRNLLGVETFISYTGCKPESVTLIDDNVGYLTLEIVYSYKVRTEDTSGPTIGSGSYATPNTATPLTHLDGGTGKFLYDSVAKEQQGYTVNVVHQVANQDENGSVVDLFRKPVIRILTGTMNLFKKELADQADALAVTPRPGVLTIDTGQIVLTYTNMLYLPDSPEVSGDSAVASIARKAYEADDLVVA